MKYTNIVLAAPTTTVVRSKPGRLVRVVVNKAVASSVITIYDNASAASGTKIGTITMPATLLHSHFVFDYGVPVANGIVVVTATGASDITIVSDGLGE